MLGETDFFGEDAFLTGDTPFMGDSLRDLDGERALATDLGFSTTDPPSEGTTLVLNPSMFLTGDPGLDSFLGIKALKTDYCKLILSA